MTSQEKSTSEQKANELIQHEDDKDIRYFWEHWGLRVLIGLILLTVLPLIKLILFGVFVVQMIHGIFFKTYNDVLATFGIELGAWISQIVEYLAVARREAPFPFSKWPHSSKRKSMKAEEVVYAESHADTGEEDSR